jgi:hypothetical protein
VGEPSRARYELVGGEVRSMAGGNRAHDLIAVDLLTALRGALPSWGRDVHGSNLKVVSPVEMVTYPDLFARCGLLPDEALACDDLMQPLRCYQPPGIRTLTIWRFRTLKTPKLAYVQCPPTHSASRMLERVFLPHSGTTHSLRPFLS